MIAKRKIKIIREKGYAVVVIAGSFGALAITRELGKRKIPCIVIGEEFVRKSKYALVSLKATTVEEIRDYLKELPGILKTKLLLFTDTDRTLQFIFSNWEELAEHYQMPFSKDNVTLIDKERLSLYAAENKVAVPKKFTSVEEVRESDFPIIIKPINHDQQQTEKAYICYDKKTAIQHEQLFRRLNVPFIMQQYVSGNVNQIYNLLLYRGKSGQVLIGFGSRKLRSFPLNYGTGSAQITEYNEEISQQSIQLLKETNYCGVAEFEYKYCVKRDCYFLIEVNGRFPLQCALLSKVNSSFIENICMDLLTVSIPQDDPFYEKKKQKITWLYLINDLRSMRAANIKITNCLSIYLNVFRTTKIQDPLWSISDPIPSLYYYKYLIKKVIKENEVSQHKKKRSVTIN
ncbi:hypothetical protein CIB95_10445 [Lottiidibacillus patelloidae]|uniref:ATP-grasp domain-containing protein n=1 Tax=Lottiidibacillus patelloidae TaxID=2670334 RepID=A0A263BSG3_9BACI|nr:hypothetical protein [Lottiidibacillus patelloidae]OZM56635.1 hypothetical protein CIB95_10445 [Lottiidibacillus patelloidae]